MVILMEPKAKKTGRKPSPSGRRPTVVTIKGWPEWAEWLGEFAESARLDKSDLVDHALAAYAETKGFRSPPKR